MEELKIETFGKVLEGEMKGWYIFVQDDNKNTGGYLILYSTSLDPAISKGFDDWVEDYKSLKQYFEEAKLRVQWFGR